MRIHSKSAKQTLSFHYPLLHRIAILSTKLQTFASRTSIVRDLFWDHRLQNLIQCSMRWEKFWLWFEFVGGKQVESLTVWRHGETVQCRGWSMQIAHRDSKSTPSNSSYTEGSTLKADELCMCTIKIEALLKSGWEVLQSWLAMTIRTQSGHTNNWDPLTIITQQMQSCELL